MASQTKRLPILVLPVAAVIAIIGGGAIVYKGYVSSLRERSTLDKIEALGDAQQGIGRSYARTLSGIEALRREFRALVDKNPDMPSAELQALADRATLRVIESEGLAGDVDRVVRYVAELDSCIARGACDPKVATGQESPQAALRNWEQWYRPYLEWHGNGARDAAQGFYRYLHRAPA